MAKQIGDILTFQGRIVEKLMHELSTQSELNRYWVTLVPTHIHGTKETIEVSKEDYAELIKNR